MSDPDNTEIQKRAARILKEMDYLSERMSSEPTLDKRLTLGIEYCECTELLFNDGADVEESHE